jgi:F-type H+-transporting ATPase subunit a
MEQLAFTALLNRLFGAPVLTLLQALHIHPDHPATPISNSFAMELLVVLLLTIFFIAVRSRLSVERRAGCSTPWKASTDLSQTWPTRYDRDHAEKFVPYLTVLALFILSCNLIGLVPGLESPTAVPIVPLGCALLTWFYYHFHGIRANGPAGYLKHFIGPQDKDMPLIMRLILPILMFRSKCSATLRAIMSLTVRLFANMFAGEMVTLVFFSLIPLGSRWCSKDCISACRSFRRIFLCCWPACTWAKRRRTEH